MAVIIVLSLALVPVVKLATSPTLFGGSGGTAVLAYYSGGDYHFLAYSYNTYGQPVVGTPINVTFSGSGAPPSSEATTNASGLATWTVTGSPPSNGLSFTLRISGNAIEEGTLPPSPSPGGLILTGGNPSPFVVDPSNSSRTDVLLVYEGPNGTEPTMYKVYYSYGASQQNFPPLNESQMTFLGTPTSYVSVFRLPPAPSGTTLTSVGIFDENGTLVSGSSSSFQGVGGPFVPPTPEQLFTSFTSSIFALLVPLMAILVAYNTYGKDKATGVLESVLARPVTRRGLALTRYTSILLSISVAVIVAMAAMELISQALLGKIFSPTFAVYTIAALVVEAAAFVGLTMLISHVLKSTGGIIGVGVGLWIVLDFFWSVFILVAALLLGVQIGSGNYLGVTIDSGFLNPAQFYGLVQQYLNGVTITSTSGASIPISPATYGLTPFTLVGAAAFWVFVPLAGSLYLATHRD